MSRSGPMLFNVRVDTGQAGVAKLEQYIVEVDLKGSPDEQADEMEAIRHTVMKAAGPHALYIESEEEM